MFTQMTMTSSVLATSPAASLRLSTRLRRSAGRALRASWLHPLNDTVALNELLADVNPLWSLTEIRAELIERTAETADTVSLRFHANRLWTGFRAGQHVGLSVEIKGVRQHRVYSLTSDPADRRTLRITVKRQPGGRVSNYLHDELRIGDVVTLSPADGAFTLPDAAEPLLLLSAGSGITPMRALLHELHTRDPQRDVVLLHICRNPDDRIFAGELAALQRQLPQLRVLPVYTTRGRPVLAELLAQVPDYATRQTLLCGPAAFMAEVEAHWQAQTIASRLQLERFGAPLARRDADTTQATVQCVRSTRQFDASSHEPLLVSAERAGLAPAYGCRIGICRTCLCHKRSGVVENLVSGERSDTGSEWIRLCVSAPRSDLELDL